MDPTQQIDLRDDENDDVEALWIFVFGMFVGILFAWVAVGVAIVIGTFKP